MERRPNKSLVALIAALLVAASLISPPPAVQGADGPDPRHAFSADEYDALCREFDQGGLSYKDLGEGTGHVSDLACHLYEDATKPLYRGLVVIKLFEGTEAARDAWSQKGLIDDEYVVVSEDVQIGLGYSYIVTLRHANSHIKITIISAPRASRDLLESMKRTAVSIVDRRGPPRKLDVAVELSMIPLVAKVTVTDAAGKPVANQRVKLILDDPETEKKVTSYFDVLMQMPGDVRTTKRAAVGIGRPLQVVDPGSSGHANDDGRHLLTDQKGEVAVALHRFLGTEPGEDEAGLWMNWTHLSKLDSLVRAGTPVGLTVRAYAVQPDEDGDDAPLGEASSTLLIDRIAQVKSVEPNQPGLDETKITLRRPGQPDTTLWTKPIRKVKAPLRLGDKIQVDTQDVVTIEWLAPLSALIVLKPDKDPMWITIEAVNIYESWRGTLVSDLEALGIALSATGLLVVTKTLPIPELGSKVATAAGTVGTILGIVIWTFADLVNPLRVTYRSQVLMDVDDDVTVYVLEGTPELATEPDAAVELTAGQMTSVHADGTIDVPSPFSIEELDDSLLAAIGSPSGSDPTPDIATEAEPTARPTPEPPVLEAARDLWIAEGGMVTRVDHLTGEVLDRWDVWHPDCPSAHGGWVHVQSDDEAAWLTVADAEWETPVLECLIRLPLGGSSSLEVYAMPTGDTPTFINGAATQGSDIWAITWQKTDPEGTLTYYDDWSLARFDRWAGSLVEVLSRVVALAPSEAGLVVLYSEEAADDGAGRPLRLGIVEPGGASLREIPVDVALPRTEQGTYVTPQLRLSAGLEGSVALYDEDAGRDIIILDPASGAVIGQVTPPEGATLLLSVWPVSDGVWMSGLLEGMDDFVRYVSFDGWASLDVDPCSDVAGDCFAQVETASDAGAWASAWPYDDAFETDLDDVVMRRYDDSGQELAEAAGSELFGTG